MNRILISTLGLCSVALPAQSIVVKNLQKPNFLIFIADDCTYSDIGCYGSENSLTPNIDKFASTGMQFTQGFEAAPISSPTRHNLYTGVWPVKSGAYPNHTYISNEEVVSVTQQLRPLGYSVGLVGKTHINPIEKFDFDFLVHCKNAKSAELEFDAINNFVSKNANKNKPFCAIIASNQPHSPWSEGDRALFEPDKIVLPPNFVNTPETREEYVKYLAEINYMDNEFGRVLSILEKNGVRDNTVIVFLSEQGAAMPFAKYTLYDAGVHSAYIVNWTNHIEPGSTSDAIVEYVDIVPTFIDIAGGEPVAPVDGKSIKDVLLGKKDTHKKYTYSIGSSNGNYSIRAIYDGTYRYILNLMSENTVSSALCGKEIFRSWMKAAKTDGKAAELVKKFKNRPSVELYNIQEDRFCMNNLANDPAYQAKIKELDDALKTWMHECGDEGVATELEAPKHRYGVVKHGEENIDKKKRSKR